MRRRLHLIFAAATVLLVTVWLLSGRWMVSAAVGKGSHAFATVSRGRAFVGFIETPTPLWNQWVAVGFQDEMRRSPRGYLLEWLPEWEWRRQYTTPTSAWRRTALALPLWMPAVLTAAATPLLWRRHRRRLRRERAGACLACGYDLAGIDPDEAGKLRCPECGKQAMDTG